jgi:hypothetical protein
MGNITGSKKILVFIISTFLLISCNRQEKAKNMKSLDFKLFTIEMPHSWTLLSGGGNLENGQISIGSKDTLQFAYYIDKYRMRSTIRISQEELHMASLNQSYDETIDGRKVLIIMPKKTGAGITGMFIDSLYSAGTSNHIFSILGRHLKPQNERTLLQVLKTIKFKKT